MFQPLLTKLIAPQANASQVQRLDLLHQLNQGLRTARLTLVSAQAGSGKTTLLGQWAASAPNLEIIWLTLDKADNSPTRFWSYVVAAFATRLSALGETGHQLIEMLQTPQNGLQPIPIETILTELINASFQQPNTSPKDICLVLDDYHLVDNREIHGAVTDLLDFLSPNLHLLIATRSDPELPLASLRARGQLLEIRTENLRFSPVEATAFYNEAMQLGLTPQQIATLEKRTEGWPAGMQLLALSLRNLQGKEREQFIQTFSGTHRYIIDYLAQEILEKLPEAVQKFLLQTSILEKLNGPLCEAVTRPENSTAEESGEGIENQSGQARLESLAAENLFVSRMDEQGQWFRYHQLFAAVLQNRLTLLYSPSFCQALHMRAAKWFVNQGWLTEALTHYFAAKNYLEAARLLSSSLGEWWQRGELLNLISWIEKLPLEVREQFPQLEIIRAWPIVLTGQVGRVNEILQGLENRQKNSELLSPNPSDQQKSLNSGQGVNPPAQLVILQAQVNFLKGYLALAQTKWAEAISYFEAALLDLPKKNELEHPLPWWLMALTSLGWAYRFSGRPHQARQAYEQAIALCRANQDLAALCGAISYLTELDEEAGQLQHAARVYRETIREAEEKLGTGLARVYMSGLFAGLGRINYSWNNLTEAENYFNLALHYSRLDQNLPVIIQALEGLAKVALAQGDNQQALALLNEMEPDSSTDHLEELRQHLLALRAQFQLRQGQLNSAKSWVMELLRRQPDYLKLPPAHLREIRLLTLARVWMASGEIEQAQALLARQLQIAQYLGQQSRVVEIYLLQAMALYPRPEALGLLEKALALATPENVVRLFLDEGLPAQKLLEACLSSLSNPEFAHKLLAAFANEQSTSHAAQTPENIQTANLPLPTLTPGSFDPLSEREREVLRGLAGGLSNRALATSLMVTENTVKVHIRNIFSKLAVNSRTQALLRAKEVGLL